MSFGTGSARLLHRPPFRRFYTITYDVADDEPWSRYEQTKNSSGKTISRFDFNDDGTPNVITYDVTNAQPWTSKTDRDSAAGNLSSSTQLPDGESKQETIRH
jgi:hypothetical protein